MSVCPPFYSKKVLRSEMFLNDFYILCFICPEGTQEKSKGPSPTSNFIKWKDFYKPKITPASTNVVVCVSTPTNWQNHTSISTLSSVCPTCIHYTSGFHLVYSSISPISAMLQIGGPCKNPVYHFLTAFPEKKSLELP